MHYTHRSTQDAGDPNPNEPTMLELGSKDDKHDIKSDDHGDTGNDDACDNIADRVADVGDTND